MSTVRALTARGPREATSAGYAAAATYVSGRLTAFGYRVRAQSLRVPAGVSWGVPVRSGTSRNVIAEPPGFDRTLPHLIVGAHLDTVPQAPGAVDNAAGVAVVVEAARLAALATPDLPIVFIAFGAEEPRGSGDARHHYGSRAYVASMPAAQRAALTGMISIDRVGVGSVVPVCTATSGTRTLAREIRKAGQRIGVRTRACVNRASDHWSFERAGMRGVRIGSVPYAEYHSARDRISVVEPAALERTGRLLWAAIARE